MIWKIFIMWPRSSIEYQEERRLILGGTGLTTLIQSLEEMSDAHQCYVLSGNRIIKFLHDFLEYDSNDWIGFNETNTFEKDIPNGRVIDRCPIFFPNGI